MMKCLLYSQHVLGVGHFFRTMAIAGALAPDPVLLVEGGGALDGFETPPHVKRVALPPLLMDPEFESVYSPDRRNLEEVKALRATLLMDAFRNFQPDVLVTELFPFGRKQFSFELLPVLEEITSQGLPVTTVCSLRDILVEKRDPLAYESRVVKILNTHYHLLLVHSDPALITLDETFEAISEIRIAVRYTGFVVRRPAPKRPPGSGETLVVASSGGGRVGADLLLATVEATRLLPSKELRLRVFQGPFMEEADKARLARAASGDPRIAILPFSTDFPSVLAEAHLSISMAGYNTCMDILAAGVPALVHPFSQNREQSFRARKLEKLGTVERIRNLDPPRLAEQMTSMLGTSGGRRPTSTVELDGAIRTKALIEAMHLAERS